MGDGYEEKRLITVTKSKKDEGKLKRFVVTPMKNLMSWEIKDSKKKERVTA
jgi:hypothetical protein